MHFSNNIFASLLLNISEWMHKLIFNVVYSLYVNTRVGHIYFKRDVTKALKQHKGIGHSSIEPHIIADTDDFPKLIVHSVPFALDNYAYILQELTGSAVLVIDPGDPLPVIESLQKLQLTPTAVLVTHRHWDHAGGVKELVEAFPSIQCVYSAHPRYHSSYSRVLHGGESLTFGSTLKVLALHTLGHTNDHMCFFVTSPGCHPILFSGDCLFIGGCGKVFEGTYLEMMGSLRHLASLPPESLVFPGHEYTSDLLMFAAHVMPNNEDLEKSRHIVSQKRANNIGTTPSTIGNERLHNPFIRVACCLDGNLLQLLGFSGLNLSESEVSIALKKLSNLKKKFDNKPK